MSDTLEDLEKRAEDRKAAKAAAEADQRVKDLTAREALEEKYDLVAAVGVRFIPGQPTFALVRAPDPAYYKRYKTQVHKAAEKKNVESGIEAAELLAKACLVYPAPEADGRISDAQKSMIDAYPGILTTIANTAASLAEGKAVDEGKG